ncbi:hypothetical protein, partial [Herbaspirillum lusitanum]|uniref:hypothetical protein n=1 Tax=Herbaspirillum lusitanum TaxID=213312 RepID=UPI001EE66826
MKTSVAKAGKAVCAARSGAPAVGASKVRDYSTGCRAKPLAGADPGIPATVVKIPKNAFPATLWPRSDGRFAGEAAFQPVQHGPQTRQRP